MNDNLYALMTLAVPVALCLAAIWTLDHNWGRKERAERARWARGG